ncbi:unnamed protein product [Albugo candida]|uniref:Uncharacterized protein n=1 Tax=Albugo candida TaxID=65357 RepID=A0A024GQ33_9STRA|nr:unnamed protein product [Albugo candida]|eukprot:CCI48845.1 unnamed protein product [Albugo candida]
MSEFYEIITLKALIGLQWELKFLDILCTRRNVRAWKRFDRIMKHFIEFARRARTSNDVIECRSENISTEKIIAELRISMIIEWMIGVCTLQPISSLGMDVHNLKTKFITRKNSEHLDLQVKNGSVEDLHVSKSSDASKTSISRYWLKYFLF